MLMSGRERHKYRRASRNGNIIAEYSQWDKRTEYGAVPSPCSVQAWDFAEPVLCKSPLCNCFKNRPDIPTLELVVVMICTRSEAR